MVSFLLFPPDTSVKVKIQPLNWNADPVQTGRWHKPFISLYLSQYLLQCHRIQESPTIFKIVLLDTPLT